MNRENAVLLLYIYFVFPDKNVLVRESSLAIL